MSKNVFISWSGDVSKSLAFVVRDWLGDVIQAAVPFMSEKDIDAGDRGLSEIADQLGNIKIGIICLTASNQFNPWLNYETGALSREISETTRVIPLTFDIEKGRIPQPIGQFQAKDFSKSDMKALAISVNRALNNPLTEQKLNSSFIAHWTNFNNQISEIRQSQESKSEMSQTRSDSDMLNEIVETIRDQQKSLEQISGKVGNKSVLRLQSEVARSAMEKLSGYYNNGVMFSLDQLARYIRSSTSQEFDDEDWGILRSAPYLYWYITEYSGIRNPLQGKVHNKSRSDDDENDNLVPF